MDWLIQLITEQSVARTVIVIGVAGAAGAALGKIRVCGVSLGIAGVLFAGLFLGHLKLTLDHHVLEFIREFGLILFVYTLGLQIGPGFFGSLRSRGVVLNGFAASIVVLGALIAALWIELGFTPVEAGVGLFSGATTNTPSLAAGQEALKQLGAASDASAIQGLAYAVAYPFGIIGIILTMLTIRKVFRVDVKQEVAAAEESHRPRQPQLNPSRPDPGRSSFLSVGAVAVAVWLLVHRTIWPLVSGDRVFARGCAVRRIAGAPAARARICARRNRRRARRDHLHGAAGPGEGGRRHGL